jgi:hypothetical protein
MVIDDTEYTIILILQVHPVPDGAHIVAKVYLTRGLYAAEDPLHLSSKKTRQPLSL